MKAIIFYLATCLLAISALAQKEKDKPVLVKFLSDSELLVAYSSGLNTVFNMPDLSINREFSLDDKKNKNAFASLSPNGDRLIAFDSKVKKRIIWDVVTGEQVFAIESGYNSPTAFRGKTQYVIGVSISLNVLSFKVYDIVTGESLGDLDQLEMPHSGIIFSPSGNLLVNYNKSTIDLGAFTIYDYPNSEILSKGDLGLKAEIDKVSFNEKEDSINLAYHTHMETDSDIKYSDFAVGGQGFEIENVKPTELSNNSSTTNIFLDYTTNAFTDGESILIPMGKDYSFNYAKSDVSPGEKWSVLHNNKGVILVHDLEDTEAIDNNGESFMKPKEVTRITVDE